jgi:hypothetical protein
MIKDQEELGLYTKYMKKVFSILKIEEMVESNHLKLHGWG